MLDLLIVGLLVALLGYASWFDYKNKLIEMWVVWLVLAFACIYFFTSGGNAIETGAVLFFTAVIWGMPTLFGFGIGDFLLFMGLAVFIGTISGMWAFYGVFIVIWLFVSVVLMIKDRKKMNKRFFYYHEYPLIPVITASFTIWFIGGLLL